MKTSTETLAELFTQMAYDFQTICDDFDDAIGKPTGTIDDYLKPKK